MAVGKVMVSLVSLVLLVGVVIGVVVVVHKNGSDDKDKASVSQKKVEDFCQPATYKDACVKSLDKVGNKDSASVPEYLKAVFESIVEEIKKGQQEAGKTSVDKDKDAYNHQAVEDCKELLQFAYDDLETILKTAGEKEVTTTKDKVADVLTWISAVFSYQSECLDSIDKPEYRSGIEKGLGNATQLTNNAIDIVAKIADALQGSSDIQIPDSLKNRRLLEENFQIGNDNYPTWFPAAERKLLAAPPAPNAVVAKDGSGKFNSVAAAIKAYPPNYKGKYVVYVKAGVYNEKVLITKKQANVFMYGDGADKTIITNDDNVALKKSTTMNCATVGVDAPGFIAKGITFRNTAGPPGEQAVALRLNGDMAAVFDCNMESHQDTLYYQNNRAFFRNCVISGTIDFIFGRGTAVVQDSQIIVRKPGDAQKWTTILADGREVSGKKTGVTLQNCKIVGEKELPSTVENYLGRPWKALSSHVVMETEIGNIIKPEGWMIWQGENFHETCDVYEYANRGPSAATNARSKLFKRFKVINQQEAMQYTAGNAFYLNGNQWLPATGAPFYLGLGGK